VVREMLRRLCLVFGLVLVCGNAWGQQADDVVIAEVLGRTITQAELDTAVYMESRRRFYHGRIADDQAKALRAEVFEGLVDRILLLAEAQRRALKISDDEVDGLVHRLQRNYNVAAMPDDHRRQLQGLLEGQAREQLMLKALEARVREVAAPTDSALQAFYDTHPDKFTTPQRLNLSVILLKVQPSAPASAWEAAEREAKRIRAKLDSGADFAQLAEMHSGDPSAENGGSLGFVHQGMLSEEAQRAVDLMSEGGVSDVVVLLQGVALFRLNERQEAHLNPLSKVRARAIGLWQREQGELEWQGLLARLREAAEIKLFDGTLVDAVNLPRAKVGAR